jgi:hypothetical protein
MILFLTCSLICGRASPIHPLKKGASMSASMQDHEVLPALFAPSSTGPRPRRVDRTLVAELLAQGRSVADVAKAAGCARQHVWRITRRSRPMQRAIADAEARVGSDVHRHLNGLRPLLAEQLEHEIRGGNIRVMLWLADRLDMAFPPAPPPKLSYEEWLAFENRREAARLQAESEARYAASMDGRAAAGRFLTDDEPDGEEPDDDGAPGDDP